MFDFFKSDGSACDRSTKKGTKIRIAEVFKKPNQGTMDMMNEIKALTEQDIQDFKVWFEQEGYPCN